MAKSNGTALKISGTLITLVGLAVGAIYAYAQLDGEVETNCDVIAELHPIVDANHDAIIGIESELSHLTQKVGENTETQKQILMIQQDILDEVRK